jgi:signal transduction histidine kinase
MDKDAIASLLHRLNNLLAVIEVQAEVARTLDTHAAYRQAVELIRQAAARTDAAVKEVRAGGLGDTAG